MRKRINIGLAALVLLMVAVIAWEVLREREPAYQGKRLSVWLAQYYTNHIPTVQDGPLGKQAETAIRQIGTNALPLYLRRLTYRFPPLKLKVMALVPDRWLSALHVRGELDHRVPGAIGLIALGPDARAALPTLIALLKDKDEWLRFLAGFTLEHLAPVAGNDLLPFLKKCLEDPDVMVQSEAIRVLGQMDQEPARVIPRLVEILAETPNVRRSVGIRTDAIRALRRFGAQAKPAVPRLVQLLSDGDEGIRRSAGDALKRVDPEAAAKAGVE
jgi:HEAT repeat protein